MNSRIAILLVVMVILLSNAFADGGIVYIPHDYHTHYQPNIVEESRQIAFIAWRDGMEQMVIKTEIKTAEHGNGTYVWIFPVPADPKDVAVYHIKTVEYHGGGKDLYTATKNEIKEQSDKIFVLSQIWPVIPAAFSGLLSPIGMAGSAPTKALTGVASTLTKNAEDYGVTVHETITEYGLTSEVITAKEANGLRMYIHDKYGVELPEEMERVFSDYIGKKFTFVVSESNGTPSAMAVMVEFPTEKPYFPLKPTSVYGSEAIPITVYVDGFWEPNTWQEIEPRLNIEHRINGTPPKLSGDEKFWGKFKEFTIVSLVSPSKYLKDDFYFEKSTLAGLTNTIREHATIFSIIILLALFGISGILAWAVLSRKGDELAKYIVAGAASILTPIATIIVLKKAEIKGKYNLPTFKKWWQNLLYYIAAAYTAVVAITAIISMLWLILALLSTAYSDIAWAVIGIPFMLGGWAILLAIGGVPLYFMHKKWEHGDGVSVPALVLILVFNAILYGMLRMGVIT